ncbi:MAG: CoA-binding protein [Fibrobacterota bacterium]
MKDKQTVVVVGATNKPDRYSHKVVAALKKHGHRVIPINPALDSIEDTKVVHSLSEIDTAVDTITMYVGPRRGETLVDEILRVHPKRVILNPGTESDKITQRLSEENIEVVQGCTLVMLATNQF